MRIPPISKELIDFLNELYPMRMPKMDETERQIFVRVGHREVVRTLEKFYADQDKRGILQQGKL